MSVVSAIIDSYPADVKAPDTVWQPRSLQLCRAYGRISRREADEYLGQKIEWDLSPSCDENKVIVLGNGDLFSGYWAETLDPPGVIFLYGIYVNSFGKLKGHFHLGGYSENLANGPGFRFSPDGSIYLGTWKNDTMPSKWASIIPASGREAWLANYRSTCTEEPAKAWIRKCKANSQDYVIAGPPPMAKSTAAKMTMVSSAKVPRPPREAEVDVKPWVQADCPDVWRHIAAWSSRFRPEFSNVWQKVDAKCAS